MHNIKTNNETGIEVRIPYNRWLSDLPLKRTVKRQAIYMYDLAQFPKIVVAGKPFSLSADSVGEVVGMGATGGMASIGRMLSKQVETANHTAEGLIQFLHLRTVTTRRAFDRSKQWWGRWYNKLTGEHPIYVQLSGHHLVQILAAIGQAVETAKIPRNAQCGIRVDYSEDYLALLKENYYAKKR